MHSHPCFEALLILSGRRVQHGLEGDIEASEHSLVFIPPDVRHGATIIEPSSVLLLQFDLAFLCPELPVEASRHWAQAAASGKVPELLAFQAQPLVRFQASGRFVRKLRDDWSSLVTQEARPIGGRQYRRAQLSLLLLDIVHFFERELRGALEQGSMDGADSVNDVNEFITSNLATQVTIQDAARRLGTSPNCLAARIKKVTNRTFTELLAGARIRRACELLLYTSKRISEIAFECGFEDHAYFSRRFRREMGVSPQDYRKQRDIRLTAATAEDSEQRLEATGATPLDV